MEINTKGGIETINARELHEYLGSKQDFSTWIKARINKYGFIDNVDFIKLHKKMELSRTGQSGIEYHISIDMAKELSMVENNEKGQKARRYFIAIEKAFRNKELVRLAGIEARKTLTDAIKESGENERMKE